MKHEQAIALMKDIVLAGRRHMYYDYTIAKAAEYKAIITGDGVERYIPQFDRREDEHLYKQRLKLTVNITPAVSGNVIDPQYKLPRSNSIENKLFYLSGDTKKYDELTAILSTVKEGRYSLDNYMGKDWIELNNIDPNAFVVIDWKYNASGERIRPYFVEYPSSAVIHYSKVHGELRWVCVHRPKDDTDDEMYILYTQDYTVILKEKEQQKDASYRDIAFFQKFPVENFASRVAAFSDNDLTYWELSISPPHNLGFVPGFFVGFVTDLTNRQTYVSVIHKAMPRLKKIIKANSELDLILSLHTFPQKVQIVPPCPECNGNGRTADGVLCHNCSGDGIDKRQVHASSQDVLLIPRPRDREDQLDLSKMIYYVQQDVKLFEAVDKFVDKQAIKCKEDVYNSEVFSRGDVPETAYQRNIDLQNVYDALWNMAVAYQGIYNFIVGAIAKITKLDNGLVHRLTFKKDFKMKSLTDLYQDLTLLNNSSAEEFVRKGVEDDIAQVLYEGNPHLLEKYYTTTYFFPFSGKTKAEIETIVALPNLVPTEIKVLWANFSYIFDELEHEFRNKGVDFYRIPREEQRIALDGKVKELVDEMAQQEIQIDYATEENT